MLNIIGLGLRGLSSVTLGASEAVRKCDKVYFEGYTSIAPEKTVQELSDYFSKNVEIVGREFVESANIIIDESIGRDVCLLVVGDGLTATTHNDLRLQAMQKGVKVSIYENASVLTVIPAKLGLFHYKMGPPVSLPFITEKFFPLSVYDKILRNFKNGMHTLVLLDLKDGRTIGIKEAIATLRKMESQRNSGIIVDTLKICAVSKISQPGETMKCGPLSEIEKTDLDVSPSSLVILSDLNDAEERFISYFSS